MSQFKKSKLDWFEEYKNINIAHRFCKQEIMQMSENYYWYVVSLFINYILFYQVLNLVFFRSRVSLSNCHLNEFLDMSQMYDGRGYHYMLLILKDICSREFDIKDTSPDTG